MKRPSQTTRQLCRAVPLLLLGAAMACGSATAQAQTAEEIAAANIAASGGEEAIARIESVRNTGRVTVESPLFGKLEGTLEAVRVPGRGYFEHVELGPIQQDKGWDGTRGWEQGPNGLRMLDGFELTSLEMQSFVGMLVALRTLTPPGLQIERLDDAEVRGRAHYVLAVKAADRPTTTVYIDRETNLLSRTSVTVTVPNAGEVPVVTDVHEYEAVAGVMMPTAVTQVIEGVSTITITLDDTAVNTAVDESMFAVPGGARTPAPQAPAGDAEAPASPAQRAGNACPAGAAPFADPLNGPHWTGWGAGPSQHRFQTAEMAGLAPADVPRLKLKWAFAFSGANQAFAQPAVAGGRVFVGSATGAVHALDAQTGCEFWTFRADGPVRTAVSLGRFDAVAGRWIVFFADRASNVYAVDAQTGELVWKRRVGDHLAAMITGAPTLVDGGLYVGTSSFEEAIGASGQYQCCTFRGAVTALDAATGEARWTSHVIPEQPKPVRKNRLGVQLWGPSGAGIWSSPTVDVGRGVVYVTTGDSYSDPAAATSDAFVAFDLDTGELLWSRQTTPGDAYTVDCDFPEEARTNCPQANGPDHDFGSSAILVSLPDGRRALVAGQKSGVVHAVDPDRRGAILWQTPVGTGGRLGGVQWGSAYDGTRVFVALSDAVVEAPRPGGESGQPTFLGVPMRLNAEAGGGLYALDPATGEVVWHTPHPGCGGRPGCSPAQSAAVTAMPGIVFSGGLDGHLRAYAADTGAIVWDVDTARDYETVNGVPARGGSIDGPGPVVAGGMLLVNSGYFYIGGMPGNVLLAFSVDGR